MKDFWAACEILLICAGILVVAYLGVMAIITVAEYIFEGVCATF